MSEPGVVPRLFRHLVDDASVFPPGCLSLRDAVAAHRAHRAAWYADLVGPFVVGSAHLAELAELAELPELADSTSPLHVIVVAAGGPGAVGPAVRGVIGTPGLVLAGVEAAGEPREIVAAFHEHVPEDVAGAVEVPGGERLDADLDLIASTRHRAKFRTGGTTSDAFPTAARLAAFVDGCARRRLPFKLTAGLHHAKAYVDPDTGFAHHGFLDVLGMLPQEPEARSLFTAFGSCGIAEPLMDLIGLGLIVPPTHPVRPTNPKEQHA
ncbi:hypothetical protein LO772_09035 [Yinghuangia sp. ASG 101]|uniref:hypothetical protein n=1 Tax=Yinghuangia sp. ASG 101 TaxID=2896848 RepID=UPI001E64095A|nr:hypothetical protein [Yinghuangia sp. ASG 101]UGQ13722.1 hypothetical protein LO772_09035 [Yinghuangia sp. ASG 101]